MAEHAAQLSVRGRSPLAPGGDLIEVLSVRLQALVDRYRDARARIAELEQGSRQREARIAELERGLEAARRLRRDVRRRVDAAIAHVERLEQA